MTPGDNQRFQRSMQRFEVFWTFIWYGSLALPR